MKQTNSKKPRSLVLYWRSLRQRWFYQLIVRYDRSLEIIILVLALAFAFYLAFDVFFLVPRQVQFESMAGPALDMDTSDYLELWIEIRNSTYEEGIQLPERAIFR